MSPTYIHLTYSYIHGVTHISIIHSTTYSYIHSVTYRYISTLHTPISILHTRPTYSYFIPFHPYIHLTYNYIHIFYIHTRQPFLLSLPHYHHIRCMYIQITSFIKINKNHYFFFFVRTSFIITQLIHLIHFPHQSLSISVFL